MKILVVSHERPLDEDEVVSGNAVRTRQLTDALATENHQISMVWLDTSRQRGNSGKFRNADELQALISREKPGVILVTYWDLVSLLPYDLSVPVVLDMVAPRPLEDLYESPASAAANLRGLRNALRRCDLIMVGNEAQRHLLVYTLIEAGLDLRDGLPVIVVPLGSGIVDRMDEDTSQGALTFVAGGVNWPWRQSSKWHSALVEAITPPDARLVIFGGRYRWHERDSDYTGPTSESSVPPGTTPESSGPTERNLASYSSFSQFLLREAHIGIELADENIERGYSQSFRSLEFLRHGLPLICNRYLPIADLIEEFDAGWLVREPAEIAPLLVHLQTHPELLKKKSENARRLVRTRLNPEVTVGPLVAWLRQPRRVKHIVPEPASDDDQPILGIPPIRERIARQWKLVRHFLLPALLGLGRPRKPASGHGVIIVTRGDLFPPDHGAAVRTLETAQALARSGSRVGLVTDDRRHWIEITPKGMTKHRVPWRTRLLNLPAPLVKLLHHSKNLPHSNSFLYLPLTDGSWYWRILVANKHISASVLQAEFPAYTRPCLDAAQALACGVVLVEHNVEYQRMKEQVPELSDSEFENLKAIEIDLCRRSGAVVCVSDNDRRKLEADGIRPEKLHTIPHGVDLSSGENPPEPGVRDRFDIEADALLMVYHGTYSYPPNREVLGIFANIILPGLEQAGIRGHLLAVGRNAPSTSPHDRIHFTGSVPKVGPWLRAADIAVVPLAEGGGTRMKILDYFAAGLPVISTRKGIEGIPARHGTEALIIDEWPAFIQGIAQLWEDREKSSELAKNGRQFAESLSWDEIAKRYLRVFSGLGR